MATLLIGDFRLKQLQYCKDTHDNIFITTDTADYSWFSSSLIDQLKLYNNNNLNVVIALGFNDCLYSHLWDNLSIDSIAAKYVEAIDKLVTDLPRFKFFVCSVTPVDSGYCFANKHISASDLTETINAFNTKIKTSKANFIDCYQYLTDTCFSTRDGVRYTADTCERLLVYTASASSTVISRMSAPSCCSFSTM